MIAFKLFRVREDGSLGPLFINRRLRVPLRQWLLAEDHPTKGYARRPGWHAASKPVAPHLSTQGRCWYTVEIAGFHRLVRPASQGAEWFIAKQMRVLEAI